MAKVSKEQYVACKDEINSLAIQYFHSRKTETMQQIWLNMWEIKDYLFEHDREIGKYVKPYASGLYENGYEFVEEHYQLAIPELLKKYDPRYESNGKTTTFLHFFRKSLSQELSLELSKMRREEPHDYAVVKVENLPVYERSSEDSVIKGLSIKKGAKRRIVSIEEKWIKVEQRNHGKQVYVRSCDVECHHESEWIGPIDGTIPAPKPPEFCEYKEELDRYLLVLLALWSRMMEIHTRNSHSKLSNVDCYRMHFTGVLIRSLKALNSANYCGISCGKEKEIFDVIDVDLLDYLLENVCRNLNTVAVANIHMYEDVGCTCKWREKAIHIPLTDSIYKDFLAKCKGIGDGEPVESRIKSTWEKFREQYKLFADHEYPNALERDKQYLKRISIQHENGCCFH